MIGFVWWRSSTLKESPQENSSLSTSTPELPPVVADRQDLLLFEDKLLALKEKQIESLLPTSTRQKRSTPQASSSPVLTPASPPAHAPEPSPAAPPPVSPPPAVAPTSSASSSTPAAPAPPPLQQFLLDGSGFCSYTKGNSSVLLSGYPLVTDFSVPDENIKEWGSSRVIFTVPDSIPPGTYMVKVRGVNSWGYCPNASTSPDRITVK